MKNIKVKINDQDKSIIMRALIDKRNNQLKENRSVEPVNEVIIKLSKK